MEINALVSDIRAFVDRVNSTLTQALSLDADELSMDVRSQLSGPGTAGGPFSNSDRLGSGSRRLSQALTPGGPGNIFNISVSPEPSLRFGVSGEAVPYADIHNRGGRIRATPKMIAKLFYLSAVTGNDNYRITALAARRDGEIKVRKRPFMDKGFQEHVQSLVRLQEFVSRVLGTDWDR